MTAEMELEAALLVAIILLGPLLRLTLVLEQLVRMLALHLRQHLHASRLL